MAALIKMKRRRVERCNTEANKVKYIAVNRFFDVIRGWDALWVRLPSLHL